MGLLKIKNDNNYAAAYQADDGQTVMFPAQNGLPNRDMPRFGSLEELSDTAELRHNNDQTLIEASLCFLKGVAPSWRK